ncbi:MAG: DNA-processing protein DprA [Pseudomonadota bacterium]
MVDLSDPAPAGTTAPLPGFNLPVPTAGIDDDERLARLRLARSENVGPRTYQHLMARYGTAILALAELPALAGLGGRRGYVAYAEALALDEIRRGEAAGARMVVMGEVGYPTRLGHIGSAPPVLWMRGDPARLEGPATALVGARNASALGLRQARRLARGLALSGEIVVSGLARGIDTAAHEGALAAMEGQTSSPSLAVAYAATPSAGDGPPGQRAARTASGAGDTGGGGVGSGGSMVRAATADTGQTAAVMAGGIDVTYPQENAELAERIVDTGGVLVSECAPGTVPSARHFPRRNRLISGLADGVVLVEAAIRSGSLITARTALDQGREVMACPGAAEDPRAGGCNALIRDGAGLVRDHRDVLEALSTIRARGLAEPEASFLHSTAASADAPNAALDDGALAQRVFEVLGPSPVPIDALCRLCNAPTSAMSLALVELELAGRVLVMPGNEIAALPT